MMHRYYALRAYCYCDYEYIYSYLLYSWLVTWSGMRIQHKTSCHRHGRYPDVGGPTYVSHDGIQILPFQWIYPEYGWEERLIQCRPWHDSYVHRWRHGMERA